MTTVTPAAADRILTHLEYLRLTAMRDSFAARAREAAESGQTHLEYLAALLEEEVRVKRERATRSRIAAARMPCIKTMDGWDWAWNGAWIRREQIMPLFELDFVKEKANLLFIGRLGVGKTRIALALAHSACARGINTRFTTAADMINRLYAATADRSLEKTLVAYTRPALLVIDEVGYLPFSKETGDLFFQVVAKRYERGSIVLTANRAFKDWNEIFADSVVAAAIIERLVHHSQIVTLRGKSYRLKGKQDVVRENKHDE